MGHLLASVNAEAAAAIHPAPDRPRLPGVGASVVYTMRAGHGRSGRTRFPAIVRDHGPNDTLALTVIIDAGDMADEDLVGRAAPGNEFHCWDYVEAVRPVAERLDEPGGLRGEVASLDAAVFGDFDRPTISLISILQDFETRLRAVKVANDALRKDLTAAESLIAKLSKKK